MSSHDRPTFDYPLPSGQLPSTAEVGAPVDPPRGRWGMMLLALGLLLIGLNLRIGVASIGPVLNDIQTSLGLSATTASLLTTIPVFAFGVFAFLTPLLMRRLGMHRLLGLLMAILAAGILLRIHSSLTALFLGTVLVGAAIAVGNVAMPPAIKQDFSHHAGLMMGLYSTVLFVGAAAASGLTAPLLPHLGHDWRAALAIWAIPAILAVLLWIPQMRRSPGRLKTNAHVADAPSDRGEPTLRAVIKDPTALGVTAFMGLQSLSYYIALTWVPTIFQDADMDSVTAGWMISFSAFPAVVTSLIMPGIAKRMHPTWLPVIVAVALTAAGFAGLAIAPLATPHVWMTCLGLGQGASISLSLSYIVWRSPDTQHTSQLSTAAQGFGYLLAGLGPLGIGALYSATGNWTVPLVVLGILLIAQLVAGIVASRPVHILSAAPDARAAAPRSSPVR